MNEYNQEIKAFINHIFTDLNDDENIIFCASTNPSPGMARSFDKFMSGRHTNKACYFSTATAIKDPDYDPKSEKHYSELRNQKKFFNRMFCVVLDDIGHGPGSRCKPTDLPKVLRDEYSWRIESSPNNFQYGYLLDKPIEDWNIAADFISILYSAGKWDAGGALANKLVRLPHGINLKKKYATKDGYFKVRDADPTNEPFNVFTPDELLKAANAGITMDDIRAGSANKLDPRRTKGTTPWKAGAYLSNLEGVSDEVVEFLNSKDMIVNEGCDWIEIECPWCEDHSEGTGNTAGYSPLGFGERPETRGFHCFHGHCKDHMVDDFLIAIQKLGGPEVGRVAHAPGEAVKWVYVANNSTGFYIDITAKTPIRYSPSSWRQMYCDKAFYIKGDKVKCAPLWKLMESDVLVLHGVMYEPDKPLIIEDDDNKRYLNIFRRPQWETSVLTNTTYNEKMFNEFIEYLIPNKDDSEWFLNHLAAKVQKPTNRGPCTVLTTPIQGSGRGTLGKMLGILWGELNVTNVALGELVKGLGGEGFNDWLQKTYVIVPEAKDVNLNPRQEHKAYEALKSGIDPAATMHLLKTKFGNQSEAKVYSTFLICSNHENTLNIPLNDRRFNFIQCATRVKDSSYFTALHEWLNTNWAPSVWMMLKNRDTSSYDPFAPVASLYNHSNEYDLICQRADATAINRLVIAGILFAEKYCGGIICSKLVRDWIAQYPAACEVPSTTYWDTQFIKALNDVTQSVGRSDSKASFKVSNRRYYLRHTIENKGTGHDTAQLFLADAREARRVRKLLMNCDAEKFRDFITELNNNTE